MNKDKVLLDGLISKGAEVRSLDVSDSELSKINDLTLAPLEKEDVFVFKVAICDNDIDRQHERFSLKAIEDMAELFIGKPLIKDHDRKADNQIGRIYDTEVIASDEVVTETGEAYTQLVAHCYVLDTDTNKDLIADIKGGIKKEVSVNLRVNKAVCSICGTDNAKVMCAHWWGREYDGQKCHFKLDDPVDAFEVSFVAVPAQAKAGTMKEYSKKEKEVENIDVSKEKELLLKSKAIKDYIYIQNEKLKEE